MKSLVAILLLACINLFGQTSDSIVTGYQKYFDEFNVTGCFLMHDLKKNKTIIYNPGKIDSGYLPASTFKIPHTLIALETGAAPDTNFTIKWDGVERPVKSWNKTHNLKSAIQNSVVWYFEEIARRIGKDRLKIWLTKLHYGNEDVSGNDPFWLIGNLRISPRQQLEFIKNFYSENLPFKKSYVRFVKNTIVLEKNDDYILNGKTGWTEINERNVGWLIGYLQKGNDVYLYVTSVQSDISNSKFSESRLAITKLIFNDLGLTTK